MHPTVPPGPRHARRAAERHAARRRRALGSSILGLAGATVLFALAAWILGNTGSSTTQAAGSGTTPPAAAPVEVPADPDGDPAPPPTAPPVELASAPMEGDQAQAEATPTSTTGSPLPVLPNGGVSSGGGGVGYKVVDFPGGEVAPDAKVVALTFDDGPDPTFTPQVLEILRRKGVPATFFMIGQSVNGYSDLVKQVVAEGHAVAGHSWSHPDLTRASDEKIADELDRTNSRIAELSGRAVTCTRPPYGARNARVDAAFNARGLTSAMWSIDTNDWRRPSPEAISGAVLSSIHPGAVILMHDGGGPRQNTVAALEAMIDGARAQGYEFVTICGLPASQSVDLTVARVGFDTSQGYTVDQYGTVFPFGGAPDAQASATWPGQLAARSLAVRPDGRSGYVLDANGGIHPFGNAPAVTPGVHRPNEDVARHLALRSDGQSGYVLFADGSVHAFGGAPEVAGASVPSGNAIRLVLRSDEQSGYVLDADGAVYAFGGAPAVTASQTFPGEKIVRDLVVRPDGQSGWVLDGYGGLHPFGGAPEVDVTGYWPGKDVARTVMVGSKGMTGRVVDVFGGMHPFTAAAPADASGSTTTTVSPS